MISTTLREGWPSGSSVSAGKSGSRGLRTDRGQCSEIETASSLADFCEMAAGFCSFSSR
uniref:Uncharacterized protein n=1 Tax=Rhizophora mucronata TaxID=61149 RepID=A0A2P2NCE4_RHIMU